MTVRARKSFRLGMSLAVAAGAALGLCSTGRAYEPQMNYALQCMGCHTPDGSGIADRVPPIRDTLPLFARMAEGRRFLVQVPGVSQSRLSNAELAQLLNWMIETLSARKPTQFVRYTEEEVAEYRRVTLVHVRATRERLLRAAQTPP